jgi:TfoX/Sxy family transcriptional regulator of competence genes
MAYNEELADRIRNALAGHRRVTEQRMFGGIAFLLRGRMCCGVLNDDLMLRVGPERHAAALVRPHVRPMDFTGRPISGFVYVAAGGVKSAAALNRWLQEAADYALSLPAKDRPKKCSKRKRAKRARAAAA